MVDPVSAPDGTSFERSAIVAWLSTNATHPCTRDPLTAEQLVPNRTLKVICDECVLQCALRCVPCLVCWGAVSSVAGRIAVGDTLGPTFVSGCALLVCLLARQVSPPRPRRAMTPTRVAEREASRR